MGAIRPTLLTHGSNVVAKAAGNEQAKGSLLRLVSALLAETSDAWETGNIYLNMKNPAQPSV